jgi:hypothetical protein
MAAVLRRQSHPITTTSLQSTIYNWRWFHIHTSTVKVRTTTMLLLLMVGKWRVQEVFCMGVKLGLQHLEDSIEQGLKGNFLTKEGWSNRRMKLHNEELHILYSFPNIIRQIKENEVGGSFGTHGSGEKTVQSPGGKARRKETTWKTKA